MLGDSFDDADGNTIGNDVAGRIGIGCDDDGRVPCQRMVTLSLAGGQSGALAWCGISRPGSLGGAAARE
jgi:hypothetical protein